jgi:hypothetical protein
MGLAQQSPDKKTRSCVSVQETRIVLSLAVSGTPALGSEAVKSSPNPSFGNPNQADLELGIFSRALRLVNSIKVTLQKVAVDFE